MIEAIMQLVKEQKNDDRFILGIDGLSRSGKTTLVNDLRQELERADILYHIFHIDDHIVERSERYGTGEEQWFEYYHLQWDVDWLARHFFDRLKKADNLSLPFYDNETDSHQFRTIELPRCCVVIIEGVFLQRNEWRDFFNQVVYLDCPRNERYKRENEKTRRQLEKFENRYWKAEDYYLKHVQPLNRADFVFKV